MFSITTSLPLNDSGKYVTPLKTATVEQAAEILKFLEMLADITVSGYLKEQDDKSSAKLDDTEK